MRKTIGNLYAVCTFKTYFLPCTQTCLSNIPTLVLTCEYTRKRKCEHRDSFLSKVGGGIEDREKLSQTDTYVGGGQHIRYKKPILYFWLRGRT